jgi:hypothetical protein
MIGELQSNLFIILSYFTRKRNIFTKNNIILSISTENMRFFSHYSPLFRHIGNYFLKYLNGYAILKIYHCKIKGDNYGKS